MENDWLVIETEALHLRYKKDVGQFSENNLQINLHYGGVNTSWTPANKDTANLGGTIRTLDGVKGSIRLDPGLVSRNGWVLIDDSKTALFDRNMEIPQKSQAEWPWVVQRQMTEQQDWYFFGYGHNYRKALTDFVTVAGKIPIPPRYAFGTWWSRYWRYTDEEIRQLVREFGMYDVPLDVFVIDMDWHLTFDLRWGKRKLDQAGQMLGWTGYTWDRVLFADPQNLLDWLHQKGMMVPLNLHPASGIQPHEEAYPAMAKAMGVDPTTNKFIPFNIIDKRFATNYFNLTLRPLERQGTDFWWIDWQQWDTTGVRGLNPTWWLNYSFYTDMERQGRARPIILARWGGLGSHRHQIGFSGDVISDWTSLEFQPYFTSTAANVAFGFWSHDIGGHIPGTVDPELYTRWVQWGALSPILRTHTTKNPEAERRMWAYPPKYFEAMKEAFQLRYALLPYIYTAARTSYDSGISMCRPLYYGYPEIDEAYSSKGQYMFGNDFMVAPVASSMQPESLLTRKTIWIPPGTWTDWFSGEKITGPGVVERAFALNDIPMYVRAGAIIPMQSSEQKRSTGAIDPLILTFIPGLSGTTRVYEDEGNSSGYTAKDFAFTPVRAEWRESTLSIEIGPTEGNFFGMLAKREYKLQLKNTWPPRRVMLAGKAIHYSGDPSKVGWDFDGYILTTTITLPVTDIRKKLVVNITLPFPADSPLLDGVPGILRRLTTATGILNGLWTKDWSPDVMIEAAMTGTRLKLAASKGDYGAIESELRKLRTVLPTLPEAVRVLEGDSLIKNRALNHLSRIIRP
ncbi:MAG: DUF5110 domain-containing protein [Ignavibacteriales bacterium]|nr:DUF5110 domain-containing protein [Ignavibacteriales bacterium]